MAPEDQLLVVDFGSLELSTAQAEWAPRFQILLLMQCLLPLALKPSIHSVKPSLCSIYRI
jgi:hypothetical protein